MTARQVSVPFRGSRSEMTGEDKNGKDEIVSVPFRGSRSEIKTKKGRIQNESDLVSVPFRGSRSEIRARAWIWMLNLFPSPFGVHVLKFRPVGREHKAD